jgi:HSP20 family protein
MTFTRLQNFSPLHRALRLHDELDNFFQLALGRRFDTDQFQFGSTPALDLYEDKENVVVKVELPGMKKEDIAISLEDGVLTVSGERKQDSTQESATICRCERVSGRFERQISLPTPVDEAKIKATYTDGILTVTLPRAEEAKPKQIPVEIK